MMQTKSSFLNYTPDTLPPAQLWVGEHELLVEQLILFLQTIFCPNNGCQTCISCLQLRDQQHYGTMWLYPDKSYTIEQFNDLFNTISFQREANESFFFIIQKTEMLNAACANKLLKSIEEPPQGYHFIFLAHNTDTIIPTILSRCIVHTINTTSSMTDSHLLIKCFTTDPKAITEFSKILDSSGINEHESKKIIDDILAYWLAHSTSETTEKNEIADNMIKHIKQAYTYLPMPGSSIMFWRTFYLTTHTLLHP